MYEVLLGILLILAIAWLIIRIRANKPTAVKKPNKPATQSRGAYHAVAIKYSENACDAAKAMTGRRFLASAAPRLPLPECNFADCRCQFAHYDDRRSKRDRRSPFAPAGPTGSSGSYQKDRRQKRDRRQSENED